MLKFKFRLTEEEFATGLRLNRAYVPMRWKLYFLVICSMLPSLGTFYLLDAGWSLTWFVVMIGVLCIYAVSAYFKQTGSINSYDQELEICESYFSNKFSHSQSNLKWGLFDEIAATGDSIRLIRLQRCSYFPNRIFGDQLNECRVLMSKGKQVPLDEVATVDLFKQIYETENRFPVHEFRYVADDMDRITKSHFQVAREVKKEPEKKAEKPSE